MTAPLPQEQRVESTSFSQNSLVENHPLAKIRRFLFGHPIKTSNQKHERVGFWQGLPLLAVDTISSLAYATEEILLALSIGGFHLFQFSLPIALTIILLLWTLVLSYSQTVEAYPEGGGAYIVAKHNIGPFASILGASTLVLDYILTVAVSVTAGIRALTSAYSELLPLATELSVAGIIVLGWLNLRGVKESARAVLVPVYAFIVMVISIGFFSVMSYASPVGNLKPVPDQEAAWSALTLFIVLRAFAGGCTAMTGIEAVANAGNVLKKPKQVIARNILIAIGIIGALSFFLITQGANTLDLEPMATESIVSQLARRVCGDGVIYQTFQLLTAGILFLAANTAFAGFPQLTAMVAKDQWLPKQLSAIGDRLVFSYGIIWLMVISCLLVIFFQGDTHSLIPLYAIGVFSAFSLNQIGMTRFWHKVYKISVSVGETSFNTIFSHPHTKMLINAFGATFTTLALIVTSVTKFEEGGYIIFLAVPVIVLICYKIRNHYRVIERELIVTPQMRVKNMRHHFTTTSYRTVVVPVSRLHRGAYKALAFAREISTDVVAVLVDVDSERTAMTAKQIKDLNWDIKIVVLESPYRSILRPIVEYVLFLDKSENQLTTIVLPEIVPAKWWQNFLHNSTANAITKVLSWSEHIPTRPALSSTFPSMWNVSCH